MQVQMEILDLDHALFLSVDFIDYPNRATFAADHLPHALKGAILPAPHRPIAQTRDDPDPAKTLAAVDQWGGDAEPIFFRVEGYRIHSVNRDREWFQSVVSKLQEASLFLPGGEIGESGGWEAVASQRHRLPVSAAGLRREAGPWAREVGAGMRWTSRGEPV
ncbi:hypothetical protein BDK51DRAFT_28405 [Blyttiomyces helicus]|uniref:Uncharacterized protein n=1 Tax=Blyttiomyces helicus TaxID=388810 RepID=A0A4P9W1P4_9FUNG|nr:hypothetical protein BDK51DRAFT_28405 [Blyttiomyces helicus]|eukprot:RKO84668.1 hypothetical protein BDK51DRAFT_28405 [Blyttiomyces helicus]